MVREQGHLGHLPRLGVGQEGPPVEPVVVVEVQVNCTEMRIVGQQNTYFVSFKL